MFNNKTIPDTIEKIIIIVEKIRNILQNNGLSVGRMIQSINYYGFFIENDSFKVWFGYALPWWNKVNSNISPLFMQIKPEWNREVEFNDNFNKTLKELGFILLEDFDWIKPYPIEEADGVESVIIQQILSDAKKLKSIALADNSLSSSV